MKQRKEEEKRQRKEEAVDLPAAELQLHHQLQNQPDHALTQIRTCSLKLK